jgi:uncharacterized membrane protein YczE
MPVGLLIIPVLFIGTVLAVALAGVVAFWLVSVIAFVVHPHHAHPHRS